LETGVDDACASAVVLNAARDTDSRESSGTPVTTTNSPPTLSTDPVSMRAAVAERIFSSVSSAVASYETCSRIDQLY